MTLALERPQSSEINTGIADIEAYLGELTLLHEAERQAGIVRGDRLAGEEQNRGFRIDYLEGERSHEPVPIGAVLPSTAKRFAQEYVDGEIPIEVVQDAWSGVSSGRPGFVVSLPVNESALGKGQDSLFTDGKAKHLAPGADVLADLVDRDDKRKAVEAYFNYGQSDAIGYKYLDDLDGLVNQNTMEDARDELEQLSEAYEFTDGDKRSIRLLNFSTKRMTETQLRELTNVVRAISDKTAGGLFDDLNTIAIIPEGYRSMQAEVTMLDGSKKLVPTNAYQSPHLLAISDRLLKSPEEREPLPEGLNDLYNQYRLPGEPTEGPGSPETKVSKNEWEITLAHELTHLAIDKNIQYTTPVPKPAPTLYGRHNNVEHIAELGAAEYAGGDSALAVPEDQRQQLDKMWYEQRGSKDGLEYKRPLGPRFVVCRELDITKPLPLRDKHPGQALPVEVTYRLNPDA